MANLYLRMDENEIKELFRIIDEQENIEATEKDSIKKNINNKKHSNGCVQDIVSMSDSTCSILRHKISTCDNISRIAKLFVDSRRIRFSIERKYENEFFQMLLDNGMDSAVDKELLDIHKRKLDGTDHSILAIGEMENDPPASISGVLRLPCYYIEKMHQIVEKTDCEKYLGISGKIYSEREW